MPVVLEPTVHHDDRGYFVETWNEARLEAELGFSPRFVQDNQSFTRAGGTFRGLHYQGGEGQAKLVRVVMGEVMDFAVDVREGSPTFGEWWAIHIDEGNFRQMFIPRGFAHGFLTLRPTVFAYRVDSYWDRELDRGVRWDDKELGIAEWMEDRGLWAEMLSERDAFLPPLRDCEPLRRT
jgi:dTDP-4-dehydrorhamnose 3,5-epimerase